MLDQSAFSATGLADSPNAEQEQAERRDDAPWDPEGLYRLEQERDETFNELTRALPDSASITVEYSRASRQYVGRVKPLQTAWLVTASADGLSATAHGDTSTQAVADVLRQLADQRRVAVAV